MRRWIATGLLAAVVGTTLPSMALAGSEGRRNSALGLTGLAVYELFRGHSGTGILAGAGAAYAWSRYSDARKHERRERRVTEYYRDRYYNSRPRYYSSYRRTAFYSPGGPDYRARGYRSSYYVPEGTYYRVAGYRSAYDIPGRRCDRVADYSTSYYAPESPYYRVAGYRSSYYPAGGPVYRAAGYRSSYTRRHVTRRHSSAYVAGYRAGYRRGVRVCETRHGI
jgi:hypothetical protein